MPDDEQNVVIVPNSTFVEDATVAALRQRPTGSVVLATNTTSACLRFEPSGAVRTQSAPLRHFLGNLSVRSDRAGPGYARAAACRATTAAGPAAGVVCRCGFA